MRDGFVFLQAMVAPLVHHMWDYKIENVRIQIDDLEERRSDPFDEVLEEEQKQQQIFNVSRRVKAHDL